MPPQAPATSRVAPRLERRVAAAVVGALHAGGRCRVAAADGPTIEGVPLPDVDVGFGRGDVEIPWKTLAVVGLVLAFIGVAAAAVIVAGRIADRRRSSPPRSILEDGRR